MGAVSSSAVLRISITFIFYDIFHGCNSEFSSRDWPVMCISTGRCSHSNFRGLMLCPRPTQFMMLERRCCVYMVFLGPAKQGLWVAVSIFKKAYLLCPIEEFSFTDLSYEGGF